MMNCLSRPSGWLCDKYIFRSLNWTHIKYLTCCDWPTQLSLPLLAFSIRLVPLHGHPTRIDRLFLALLNATPQNAVML